jgi:4-coumarate--CoA ligase
VQELVHHLKLTKPKLFIVERQLLESSLAAAAEVGIDKSKIFAFDTFPVNSNEDVRSWNELLKHGEKFWVTVVDPAKAVSQYASTSGTSGLPKAALLPHNYHVSQASFLLSSDDLPYKVQRLTALPPFHVFATPIVPASVRQGHTTYIMRRFDMKLFVEYIQKFGISETYLAPPVIVGLPQSAHCTREALRSLRQIWFGGASLKYSNQLPLYAMLHEDAKIQPVWGMTEAGWITAGIWPEKHTDDSVGRPLPGYHVK